MDFKKKHFLLRIRGRGVSDIQPLNFIQNIPIFFLANMPGRDTRLFPKN
jgi:hypothetical protein